MFGDVSGAFPLNEIVVDTFPMSVVEENCIAVGFGPIVTFVDKDSAVRMPASEVILHPSSQAEAYAFPFDEVKMVSNGINAFVGVLAGFTVSPWFVMGSLNDVVNVGAYGVGDKGFSVVIPIDPPWVGTAIGIGFPNVSGGVISPDASVESNAVFFGTIGFANPRPVGTAMRAVEPTIGAPCEAVGHIVGVGKVSKAVQEKLWLGIRFVILVFVRNEKEVGGRHYPSSTKADFETAYVIEFIVEDRAFVVFAIEVCVFKNQNPVLGRLLGVLGVTLVFRDPEPSPIIRAESNGLPDIRFSGKEGYGKAIRDLHPFGRIFRWKEEIFRKGTAV